MTKSSDKNNSPISSWAQWFDRAAEVFDDPRMKVAYYSHDHNGEPYSQAAVKETFTKIWERLKPQADDSVLDVGCGVGFFTREFGGRVKKVVGTDIAAHMIKSACQLNKDGTFLVCRCDALPFKPKQFDRILSYGVTQYLPDEATAKRMLDEILPLAKDGGRILIGDILDMIDESSKPQNKPASKGQQWWPESLNHKLSKLYLSKDFFTQYCDENNLICQLFEQKVKDRHIPTPRYDVVMNLK